MRKRNQICIFVLIAFLGFSRPLRAQIKSIQQWNDAVDAQLLDYYEDPAAFVTAAPPTLSKVVSGWEDAGRNIALNPCPVKSFPFTVGWMRARLQQAIVLEMARAIRENRLEDAKALRAELNLPRGVSSSEGALILQSLVQGKQDEAARILVREAITWQTTRVRQLFDEAVLTSQHDSPLPGRLMERMGEALTLADLPQPLRDAAGLTLPSPQTTEQQKLLTSIQQMSWSGVHEPLVSLRDVAESTLPSLLSDKEKQRRERLLLKLVGIIPKEYASGVRDGQVTIPLEYHEAFTFTQQARQIVGELAPLWLANPSSNLGDSVRLLEDILSHADRQIFEKANPSDLYSTCADAGKLLQNKFGISLQLAGTTADIVEEVMLETRTLLSNSLSAALNGQWKDAASLRLEAYTTYDPELEARLMPRDPQLATDIEHLMLDGLDQPGIQVLLDRRANATELQGAYGRVYAALDRATAQLKSGISPTAAAVSAGSIVAREGLEGLLVAVAVLAGLRGDENAQKRRLFWLGIAASAAATAITWLLSQTLVTSLRAHGELIEVVTGILAIGVLLLITNWLFHQVYWRQWVTTLKSQAASESAWQLLTVGFLVGYREGFETVLFLQSLVLDGSGQAVAIGVTIGCILLIVLGVAVLKVGLKLPYYRILLLTAALIGFVLFIFVGGTARSAQTVGWLPVHRLTAGSWPSGLGRWFGLHNTIESVTAQFAAVALVLVTWRVSKWTAHRKAEARRQACTAPCEKQIDECCMVTGEAPIPHEPVIQIRILSTTTIVEHENALP